MPSSGAPPRSSDYVAAGRQLMKNASGEGHVTASDSPARFRKRVLAHRLPAWERFHMQERWDKRHGLVLIAIPTSQRSRIPRVGGAAIGQPKLTRRSFLRGFAVGAMGSVGVSGYAEQAAYDLRVEHRSLSLPKWDADGYRIAVLADVHVNFPLAMERARKAVDLALEERPDLLVMVGDFVNSGAPETLGNVGKAFERVHSAECPCLAVLGNHDYWVWDPQDVADTVTSAGWTLLRNEAVKLDGVTVAGLDDALMGHSDPSFIDEGAYSRSLIALLHEPDFVTIVPKKVSLQLSGHSHGGQMCLPLGLPVHLPRGGRDYVQGFFPNAPVPLYVTRGVGTTGLDFRTFCPPEVSILTLSGA